LINLATFSSIKDIGSSTAFMMSLKKLSLVFLALINFFFSDLKLLFTNLIFFKSFFNLEVSLKNILYIQNIEQENNRHAIKTIKKYFAIMAKVS